MNNNNFDRAEKKTREESEKHESLKGTCQTYEDASVWRFGHYIDIMQRVAECLGRDKLIWMIMRAVDERHERSEADDAEQQFIIKGQHIPTPCGCFLTISERLV